MPPVVPLRQRQRRRSMSTARRGARGLASFAISLTILAVLGAGALLFRLQQGPLTVPGAAAFAERALQAEVPNGRVMVESVVFSLGEEGRSSGLQMLGVTVEGPAGAKVLSVPTVSARLSAADLVRGRIEPTEIVIHDASARFTRTAEGQVSLALVPSEETGPVDEDRASGASAAILAALSGSADEGAIAALTQLRLIEFTGLHIDYDDALSGRSWSAEDGFLTLERRPDGAFGALFANLTRADGTRTSIAIEGDRRPGAAATDLRLVFRNAAPGDAADQIAALDVLRAVEAPVSGALDLRIYDDGRLAGLSGQLRVGRGGLLPEGMSRIGIDRAIADFSYDPETRRFALENVDVATDQGSARFSGWAIRHAPVEEGGDGRAVMQLDLRDVTLAPSGLFEAPVSFASGRVTARLTPEPLAIEIGELFLEEAGATFHASGVLKPRPDGLDLALDYGAEQLPLEGLFALWPPNAAKNARDWAVVNMEGGEITRMSGGLRLSPGRRTRFSAGFIFEDAVARYLPRMSPIEGAEGIGEVTEETFSITLQDASVVPAGVPIDVSQSSFRIPDISAFPARAEVVLEGEGRIADVLALIDQEPL
ncbi:MAG: hypothetical protein AAFW69_02585, partial [Pseudomonadota bacterium]